MIDSVLHPRRFLLPLFLAAAMAVEILAAAGVPLPVVPVRVSRVVAGFPWAFDRASRPPRVLGLEGAVLDSSDSLTLRQEVVLPGVIWQDTSMVIVGLHWFWSNVPDTQLDLGALPPGAAPIPYTTVGMDEQLGLVLAEPAEKDRILPPSALRLPARSQALPDDFRLVCAPGGPSFRLIPVRIGTARTLVPPPNATVPPLLSPVFTREGRFDGFCLPFTSAGSAPGSWEWIPADEVSRRVGFLAENRTNLTSGYMGVFLGASDPSAPETTVYLRGVVPESPADTAGLEGGDILARIEGLPLHSPRQAVQLLRRLSPNARIHVDLIREGRVERRTLILGQRQTELAPVDELVRVQLPRIREVALDRLRVNPMPPLPEDVDANPTMGVFVRGVSAPLREAIGWKGPESALVAMVLPGFPAEKAGLHAGDLLLDIDGRPVMRVPDVAAILETMRRGQVVTVRYFRQGRILTASVTLR